MVQFYLEGDRLKDFTAHLMGQKTVYAPHRQGRKSFAFDRVTDPGAVVLDYPRTMGSLKKFFLPAQEELMSFNLADGTCRPAKVEPADAVFLGVHSYDLAAVRRLDHNFSQGNPERNYLTRRQDALWIGTSYDPDQFHFAGSVGIDPQDTQGFDLFLTRLLDGYVLEVLTPAGEALMKGFTLPAHEAGKPARKHFRQHIFVPQDRLTTVMAASFDNPVWAETAAKCVGCGTCNLVCPTCYCFDVVDQVDIDLAGGSRGRHWDACMLREFTEVAGGEAFREGLAERQRHRVFRKFKYLSETTGQPWCVGCGRCTAYCTAGISIVAIVNRLVGDFERSFTAPV